jgi:hypothetical protein
MRANRIFKSRLPIRLNLKETLINAADPQVDTKKNCDTICSLLINTKLLSNHLHPCDFHLGSSRRVDAFF